MAKKWDDSSIKSQKKKDFVRAAETRTVYSTPNNLFSLVNLALRDHLRHVSVNLL